MLEILDTSLQTFIKVFDPTILDKDIIYSQENWALRLRAELVSQIDPNGDTLPFVSYFRENVSKGRYNQNLVKKGIILKNSDSRPTSRVRTRVHPVVLDYRFVIWLKDGIDVNKYLELFYNKYHLLRVLEVDIGDNNIYRLGISIDKDPVTGMVDPKGGGSRKDMLSVGQIFFVVIDATLMGFIPSQDTNSQFKIKKVIVNYPIKNDIAEKFELNIP